jgi:hypothetical protein
MFVLQFSFGVPSVSRTCQPQKLANNPEKTDSPELVSCFSSIPNSTIQLS